MFSDMVSLEKEINISNSFYCVQTIVSTFSNVKYVWIVWYVFIICHSFSNIPIALETISNPQNQAKIHPNKTFLNQTSEFLTVSVCIKFFEFHIWVHLKLMALNKSCC